MLMNWSQKYGLRSYLKSSLWLVPFIAIPIELVVTRLLRPISILAHVGNSGLEVIESVYPDLCLAADIRERDSIELGAPDRVVQHQGASSIILAVNLDQLIADAERSNGVIEFVCQIGDFVSVDEPLFNLYGGTKMID